MYTLIVYLSCDISSSVYEIWMGSIAYNKFCDVNLNFHFISNVFLFIESR
jgi:hypothetical protein